MIHTGMASPAVSTCAACCCAVQPQPVSYPVHCLTSPVRSHGCALVHGQHVCEQLATRQPCKMTKAVRYESVL
jgi:uncharacterized membrane protein